MVFADYIGFIGVFLLLIAFMLNLFNILKEKSASYLILNIIGAGLLCYASILINFMPFVLLEGIWCAVATAGLIQLLVKKK